ncbi:hypothetical protein Pen02_53500 [Plantactinospora endophytica]|uniref:Uncharacterized protein n=1 Tax=Plantactinospora endophytica TaxID=673535 RepID=A0ABQ4E6R4_9ACTN|nr:hypothetical protein Pen02_53500 [Plantactinospora endophytica]
MQQQYCRLIGMPGLAVEHLQTVDVDLSMADLLDCLHRVLRPPPTSGGEVIGGDGSGRDARDADRPSQSLAGAVSCAWPSGTSADHTASSAYLSSSRGSRDEFVG